jgi:hypothetical protein
MIRDLLPWGSSDDSGTDRPPKPENETETETVDIVHKTATVEYRNGNTETIDCHGMYYDGDDGVYRFATGRALQSRGPLFPGEFKVYSEYHDIPAVVLGAEPDIETVGEETREYRIEYEYEWGKPEMHMIGSNRWHRTIADVSEVSGDE